MKTQTRKHCGSRMYQVEILTAEPPGGVFSNYDSRRPLLIAEGAAHPLGHAWSRLPNSVKPKFPHLRKAVCCGPAWVDEKVLFSPNEVLQLWGEFNQLLALCRFEVHEHGLDPKRFMEYWRSGEREDWWQEELEETDMLLRRAIEANAWVFIWH